MCRAAGTAFEPAPHDPLTVRTVHAFSDLLRLLLPARVTRVAEAAFQDQL